MNTLLHAIESIHLNLIVRRSCSSFSSGPLSLYSSARRAEPLPVW